MHDPPTNSFGGGAPMPAGEPDEGPSRGGLRRSAARESVARATERIQEIIDAAERVADEIQRDAEAEAERYLAERRRQADRLAAEQAERLEVALVALRGHLTRVETEGARLLGELEHALSSLTGQAVGAGSREGSDRPAVGAEGERGEASRDRPVARPVGPRQPARLSGELRDTALIRATQMAVTGAARGEIEASLRDELGVADPASLVDQVLGSRSPG